MKVPKAIESIEINNIYCWIRKTSTIKTGISFVTLEPENSRGPQEDSSSRAFAAEKEFNCPRIAPFSNNLIGEMFEMG